MEIVHLVDDVEAEPAGLAARADDGVEEAGIELAREEHVLFRREGLKRNVRVRRERVFARQRYDNRLLEDRFGCEHGPVNGRNEKSDMKATLPEGQLLLRGAHASHDEVEIGVPLGAPAQDVHEHRRVSGPRNPNRQLGNFAMARTLGQFRRMFGLGEDEASLVNECFSRLREVHVAFVAIEEPDPELILELPDLLTQRGLADVEAFGGMTEMQTLRDGDRIAQVSEFHSRLISNTSHMVG
jgi:hypothetical protein